MQMIKKIFTKIHQFGLRYTILLTGNKLRSFYQAKINILNKRPSYVNQEWLTYWHNYNYIRRKYLKKLERMPVTTGSGKYSNKVWWCWLQGEENCPKLQQKCLKSLRENLHDRNIIVITNQNLHDYIELPTYIIDKHNRGLISDTHFSDLIRLQLLIQYGGTWIDSSVYCTGYDKTLFDRPLFVYKNLNYIWYAHKNQPDQEPLIADSWLITSEIHSPTLIAVRDLLFDYWKNHDTLIDYFLIHYFFTLVVQYKYKPDFDKVPPRSHLTPHLLQYEWLNEYNAEKITDILQQSPFHKLTHKVSADQIPENCLCYKFINQDNRYGDKA